MGADFCFLYLIMKKGKEPDWNACIERLVEMSSTHLSKWPGKFQIDIEDVGIKCDFDGSTYCEENESIDDSKDRSDAVRRAQESYEAVRRMFSQGSRDSDFLIVGGLEILLTGGMTWGDDPTDGYTKVNNFYAFELWKVAGMISSADDIHELDVSDEAVLTVYRSHGDAVLFHTGPEGAFEKKMEEGMVAMPIARFRINGSIEREVSS